MRRPRTLVIISLTILLCQLSCQVFGAVVWSDEFNDPDINPSIWTYDVGGGGFGNGQLEYNTALSQNSYIENGNLVLEARRENYFGNSFTSARMLAQGRFAFKYGTLEARIKLPDTANGLWPAFWLLGNNFGPADWPVCGEIDIVEMGSAAGIAEGLQQEKINCAMHFSDVADTYQYYDSWLDAPVDLSLDYHLYKVEWTPTDMTFYLDGVPYGSWDITPAYLSEFHNYAFPILNIAIGGWNYVQINDPGLITATFPAKMYIDWIRLEDNAFTEILLGADNEETVNFGVYTDTTPVNNSLTYGVDADLFIWNNMIETTTTAYEGSNAWSFDIAGGVWYGMGVNTTYHRNMNNYSDGSLHFHMKSTTTEAMKVGVKSSVGDEFWLPLGDETAEFGFARDGNWHEVIVPLNRFANTDFPTIHQMFMLAGDLPASGFNVSIDNVYWEESVARPTPANGNFGVYTETVANKDAGEFILGVEGDFFIWADTLLPTTQTPYEGTESISLTSAPALSWFGAAFTPNVKHNLTAFRYPSSRLHFAMKTSSTTTFQVGMKSGNVDGIGQQWITFASGSDPYGFVRDGNWHVVEIPMSDIITEVDLFEVSQLFQILGTTGPITGIEIDDVAFTGGGDPLTTQGGGNIPPTISITSPVGGTFFNPGENVLIEADASDADGTVTKVEFFEGANLLGEDLTSPYSFTVNSVTEGTYSFTAAATDSNDVSRTSSSVTVYVGTPELTSINVSPPSATVKAEQSKQFTAAGLDQFGLAFPVTVNWSVSGGGLINGSGLFSAVVPGGPYTVTATDTAGGILSDTASVTVEAGGICSGDHPNGEFSWEASGDTTNPTLTFIPSGAGIGTTVLLLQYGRIPDGGFPGNWAAPNVPFQINAIEGEKIYFYYTYNTPTGEHNTMDSKLSFVVGDCQTADTTVPVPNPLTWSVLPYATGETSVSMTATTALDASGVEYYFANLTDPAHDSGWQASSVYNDTGLTASTTYSYTVTARDLSVNQNQDTASTTESATTDTPAGQLPYYGTPLAIPGQVEAEDFDTGGEGIAYSDSDVGNNGGAYRPSEDVDLENCSEGGYNLAWIRAGEWTEYTVDVTTAGDYTLDIRAAGMNSGGAFHVEFGGIDKTGTIVVPVTGGWQNWTTLTTTVNLSAGVQVMRFVNESTADAYNLSYFDFTYIPTADTDPPTPNPATFASAPAAISDTAISMVATTGSDASGPVEYLFTETSGNPGGTSSAWQTSTSYTDSGLNASTQYTYTVTIRDSLGNTGTASSGASATTDTPPDTDPPTPNPASFATAPYATGTSSIAMVATTGSDASGPVEYLFTETSGNPGSTSSAWQTSTSYTDSGLNASTQYTYTVQMRDSLGNTGSTSNGSSATTDTPPDTDPPTPNPAGFATAPYATGTSSIAMVATTGSDASGPVEYLFTETSGNPGGTSSAWQTSTSYTDTGLNASTQYTYTVTMRDSLANTGTASSPANATTDPPSGGWTQIIYDDFESGFGNWTDGGSDCVRYTGGTYAYQGSAAIDLQDNTNTSVMSTSNLSLSSYTEVKVDFAYRCQSMESNEDFWLQISTNGGSNYTTVQSWAQGTDFVNGQFYPESVTITGYTLTGQTRIRFRCDASGNGDDVYIDDVTISASSGGGPDTDPPTPNPATFASAPAAISDTAISMVATTGSDASGPVEYLFTETSGNPGGTSSAWQTSTSYTDSGLNASTQYTYTVQMRDSLGNTGSTSNGSSATTDTPPDTDPPTPNPAGFATAPYATGTSSIAMVATTGSDASGPVEYLFTETSGNPGGTSSAWQTSTSYTDSGLNASTQYTYTVQMRDSLGNTGSASTGANATTDPDTGGICTGEPANGEYTWEATGELNDPSITFIPSGPGIGNSTLIIYYSLLPDGAYPGYFTTPNTPFQITASEGQLVYFYYTYNTPTGQHSTVDDKHTIVIGNCQAADTTAPTPNPAGFATAPNATGASSIAMVATTGSDASGPVEYLFTETSGNPGGTSSAWQTSTSYTDSGLNASTQYTYTVQMRDSLGNTGSASSGSSATTDTPPDTDPPTPNPAGFATAPYAMGTSSIAMVATTGSDTSGPVEYYFACTSGGGNDSGWQTSTSYADTGLTPDTSYTYTIQMRDSLGNTGTASSGANATTDPAGGPVIVFSDNFESSTDWTNNWSSYGAWARKTDRKHDGSYSAEIDGSVTDSALVSTSIDVSGKSSATITLWWFIEKGLDTGEYLAFDTNTGSGWVQQANRQGNVDQENVWASENIVVDVSGTSSLQIRFRGKMSGSREDAYVDQVEVSAE